MRHRELLGCKNLTKDEWIRRIIADAAIYAVWGVVVYWSAVEAVKLLNL